MELKYLKRIVLKNWKINLRIFLAFQFLFVSFPGHTTEVDFRDVETNVFFAELIEEGSLNLEKNPEAVRQLDRYTMFEQEADFIRSDFNTETNERQENIRNTIILRGPNISSDMRRVEAVTAHYQGEEDTKGTTKRIRQGLFYLEGKNTEYDEVIVRQYIPGLENIIKSTQISKSVEKEFIVLLDSEGNLFLIDQLASKYIIGKAPVPVVSMSMSVPEFSSYERDKMSIEFIYTSQEEENRESRMTPTIDIIPERFSHISRFTNGDLIVTYMDDQGQRHLLEYIERDEIRELQNKAYKRIEIMVALISPANTLTDLNKMKLFERILTESTKEDGRPVLYYDNYATLLEEALHKLVAFYKDGSSPYVSLQERRQQLQQETRRHNFSLEEWRNNLLKGNAHSTADQGQQEKKEKKVIRTLLKYTGVPYAVEKILSFINGFFIEKTPWADGNRFRLAILISILWGFLHTDSFAWFFNILFNYHENWNHIEGGKPNIHNVLFTFVMTGIGLSAALVWLPKWVRIAWLQGRLKLSNKPRVQANAKYQYDLLKETRDKIKKQEEREKKPNTLYLKLLEAGSSALITTGQKLGNYTNWPVWNRLALWGEKLSDFRKDQKKGERTANKLNLALLDASALALLFIGQRLSGYSGRPVWNWFVEGVERLLGYPLASEAFRHEVSPWRSIPYQSQDGTKHIQLAGGDRIWSKTDPRYAEYEQALYEFLEKRRRVGNLSFQLSAMVLQSNSRNPDYLRAYSTVVGEDIANVLRNISQSPSLELKWRWLRVQLSNEMLKAIDEVDLSDGKGFSFEYLKRFHQRALELNAEYEHLSRIQRLRQVFVTGEKILNSLRKKIFYFEKKFEILRSERSMFAGDRFAKEVFTDHAIGIAILLGFQARGGTETESMHERVYDSSSFLGLSPPGLADTGQNLLLHGTFGAAVLFLTLRNVVETITEDFEDIMKTYAPELPKIENEQKPSSYMKAQFKAFSKFGEKGNVGETVRKRELNQLALWQIFVLTIVIPRWLTGSMDFSEAVMASIYYNAWALVLYRWPWSWILSGAAINKADLEANLKKMRDIQIKFSHLADEYLIKSETEYRDRFGQALTELFQLYDNGKKESIQNRNEFMEQIVSDIKNLSKKNPQIADMLKNLSSFSEENMRSAASQLSIEEIQDISRVFVHTMSAASSSLPLHTKKNTGADWLFTTNAGPVLTTLLATYLLIESYDPRELTLKHVAEAIGWWSVFMVGTNAWNRPLWKDVTRRDGEVRESWKNSLKKVPSEIEKRMRFLKPGNINKTAVDREVNSSENLSSRPRGEGGSETVVLSESTVRDSMAEQRSAQSSPSSEEVSPEHSEEVERSGVIQRAVNRCMSVFRKPKDS